MNTPSQASGGETEKPWQPWSPGFAQERPPWPAPESFSGDLILPGGRVRWLFKLATSPYRKSLAIY